MDKFLGFFKNIWTRRCFSVLSIGYGAFLAFIAWLTYAYYLRPQNQAALLVLYIFINLIFGLLMFYTRKQLITQLVACFLHPIILVILVFAFGEWYIIIPAFVVSTFVFFAAGSSESIKTVLGTLYLIFFVLGVLGYLTLQMFAIDVLRDVDYSLRVGESDYLVSTEGSYRLVMYVDSEEKEQRTVSYYIEQADLDIELPFLKCERVSGCVNILNARFEKQPEIEWFSDSKLMIDGKIKDIGLSAEAIKTQYSDADNTDDETAEIDKSTVTTD